MPTTNKLDSNVSQIVLKKFLPGFMSDLVLAKTVDRQLLAGEINSNTGDSVSFKRPHQFSSLRSPTGDISGQTKNNIVSGKATGRVGNYITVAVEYTQLEEAIKLNQLDEILAPVRQRIVTDLETELAQFMMRNGAQSLGSPNTPINKWSDVAQTASFLKDLGVEKGENYAVMDPWSAQRLADAQSGLHASDQLVRTAWEDAQIASNFGGIRALMSNGLASRNLAASARLAASNPETFTKWLQNNASDLDRVGVDPQQVAQMYQQDPKGFGDFADHLGLSAVGPDKYFDIQDKIVGRQIDQGKLAEQVRSNQAGEALQQRGQNITARGQDLSYQSSMTGHTGRLKRSTWRNFNAWWAAGYSSV